MKPTTENQNNNIVYLVHPRFLWQSQVCIIFMPSEDKGTKENHEKQ